MTNGGRPKSGKGVRRRSIRIPLMVVLIVVLVFATIARMRRNRMDEAAEAAARAESPRSVQDLVDVDSVVQQGTIVSASWRAGDKAGPEHEPDAPATGQPGRDRWDLFGGEARRRERAEKGLEEAVSKVQGLGVYVAKEEDGDEEDDG